MTHTELCKLTAERFVKTMAIYESTMLSFERPDVLNFDSSGRSWLYEIKMSRSDFLADKKKLCRQEYKYGQFGDYRYFVCYGNFIKPDEVPDGWGLYHFKNDRFYRIKEADVCCFMKSEDVSARQRRNVQLLINFIICERTNIVFAKRVLKNREIYGGGEKKTMTEIELFDRLNPKRDLPQATCDVISRVYEVMSKETEELKDDIEARKFAMAMSEKVEKQLRKQIKKMKCCSNCKNCRRKFIKENVFEHTCKVEYCKNYDKWEMKK